MKTLILFYSHSHHTRDLASQLAKELSADRYEIKELKRPGVFRSLLVGTRAAIRGETTDIYPVTVHLADYDKIVVMGPIWGGYPAPPVNNILQMLPSGKEISVRMVSASGNSRAKERVAKQVQQRGCRLAEYVDLASKRFG